MPSTLLASVRCFVSSQRGATAIEYSLIVALIAVAVTAALNLTGKTPRMYPAPPAMR